MKKTYKLGDKVMVDNKNGVITLVTKIPNDSDDKYLDYLYEVSFPDNTTMDLSYEDLVVRWNK